MQAQNGPLSAIPPIDAPQADNYLVQPPSTADIDSGLAVEELVIRLGDEAPHIHKLNHSILTIGRDSTNDIVLKTGAVSRHHARLDWRRGVWYVTDLDSTNGTQIDGEMLPPHTMRVFSFEQRAKIGPYEVELRRSYTELSELTQYIVPKPPVHDLSVWRTFASNAPATPATQKPAAFSFSMWPLRAFHNGKVFIAVQNESNDTQRFKLRITSDAPLSFTSAAWEITVPAGVEKRVALIVHADSRPLVGDIQHHPFEIAVETEDKQRKSAEGTVAIKPRLSQRMVLFGLTVLFLLLISYLVTALA